MKFIDEYRNAEGAKKFSDLIHKTVTKPWTIMEVCGGQTHSIVKYGIEELLPDTIRLLHGPGCPVCVTPIELIDKALELSSFKNTVLCSFGDMLRVPGTKGDLLSTKASGADIRIVYSPLDALKIARAEPDKQVVFFSVGFETTAPATAMAVYQAQQQNVKNFSLLVSHVLVPPAMELILSSANSQVDGFLAAGHVCTVVGFKDYERMSKKYDIPIIVTGFEPLDILQGITMCLKQLEQGLAQVENQYARSVSKEGNSLAQDMTAKVFKVCSRAWRGIGEIQDSGLKLQEQFIDFDAETRFDLSNYSKEEPSECISGLVLQGQKKPVECSAFGTDCTPENPLGAPMVSSEGACAAYFQHRKH